MADFLASFNIGGDAAVPADSDKYGSVDELALHLRGHLEQKTTPTRAEHVAVTLELRPTVQFHLSLTESENEAFESLNGIDPSIGGVRSASTSVDPAGQALRSVSGNDTLMNQSDSPVLQRTVAKHIIGILGTTDHGNWTLRDLSRGQQGWNITYICKDSLQQWNREKAKLPSNAVIGEYSQKEPDGILSNRPAFDCRGSITISFNRGSRAISVRYDHTLLHKTVQQLSEEWQPPVREPGAGYQRQLELKQQKTPKTSKRADRKERKRKEREETVAEGGIEGERPVKRKKRPSKKKAKQAQEPPVMPDFSGAQAGDGDDQSAQPGSAAAAPIAFFVTQEEAARRQSVARKLLSDNGVPPDSLSEDQMNIFSNQSPELQRDSVAMLARYGAERLHIIHPSNKDKSSTSNTPVQTTQATPSGPMTTKELAPETTKSGRKPKLTAKPSSGANASGTPLKPPKTIGKSRVSCLSCKSRMVKCPKERPACAECASYNQACEYPPQKPRNNNKKSEPIVIPEDEAEEEEEREEDEDESDAQRAQQPETSFYDGPQHPDASHVAHADMLYSNNMPVSDMLTPHTHVHQAGVDSDYFQSGSGLVLPQASLPQQDSSHNASGLALPQVQPKNIQPAVTAPKQSRNSKATSAAARRSLTTGTPAAEANINAQDMNATASQPTSESWVAANNQPLKNNIANTVQQTRQQVPQPQAQQSPRMLAAVQAQARTSPFQTGHQGADSRQSHRAQSRTPNAEQNVARGHRAPPQANNDLVASSNHSNFGRYSSGNAPASDANNRIAYEPYSWQKTSAPASSSYPAYDYNRTTSTSMSMSSPSTMAPSYNSSTTTSNQYSGSQSHSSRTQDRTMGYSSTGSYQKNQQTASNPTSLHNFDMRGAAQKRPSSGAVSKQPYSPYGSQQSHDQQMGQPGWNNFNYSGSNQFGANGQGWM